MTLPDGGDTRGPEAGDGHRRRLRQKFLRGGLNAFLDYEII